MYLPVVKFDRYNIPSQERREEWDRKVVQLINSHLHWRFEHLRIHTQDYTGLNNACRHFCDFCQDTKWSFTVVFVLFSRTSRKTGRYFYRICFRETPSADCCYFCHSSHLYWQQWRQRGRMNTLCKWGRRFWPLPELARETPHAEKSHGSKTRTTNHKQTKRALQRK